MTKKIKLQIAILCALGVFLFATFALIITLMYGTVMAEVARTLEVTQFKTRVKALPVGADSNVFQYEREQKSSASLLLRLEMPDTAGIASWYDYRLPEAPWYSYYNDTAASREYPKGTWLLVSYRGESVAVRVNDYVENPDVVIDLSSHAFQQLALLSDGLIPVKIRPLHAVNNYLESKSNFVEQDVCRDALEQKK